jgi:hypothetical protein
VNRLDPHTSERRGCVFVAAVTLGLPVAAVLASEWGGFDHALADVTGLLPCALVAVFALAMIGWVLWEDLQDPPPGHCRACGYDLRGRPSETSCPECGAERRDAS